MDRLGVTPIRRFNALSRAANVTPVIIDGGPDDPQRECCPSAVRFKFGAGGALTGTVSPA